MNPPQAWSGEQPVQLCPVVDELLRIRRLLALPEVRLPLAGTKEDDAPLQRGVATVEVEVARRVAGNGLVVAAHLLGAQEAGHPLDAERGRELLEHLVREDEPGDVKLARSETGHLPVEQRRRAEVAVDDVADARVTPRQDWLALVRRPVPVQPVEPALHERRGGTFTGDHVVPSSGVPDVTSQMAVAAV